MAFIFPIFEILTTPEDLPGFGPFGRIFHEFVGKAKEAIAFLMKEKDGEAIGALHHKDIGEISLVYGNDSAGLKKNSEKHPEVLDDLQAILDGMHIISQSENRIKLESDTHYAVVSRDYNGTPRIPWLLSAFEKKENENSVLDNTMDTGETLSGERNDTATPQNTVSENKDSNNSENASVPEQGTLEFNDNPEVAAAEAQAAYLSNYSPGWKGLGVITEVSKEEEFAKWLDSSTRKTKPFSEYKSVEASGAQNQARQEIAPAPAEAEAEQQEIAPAEEAVVALAPAEGAKVLNEEQGNRLNPDGSYAIDTISSIDDLTDEDFINPSRTVQLPTIAENLAKALNIVGKPVIIKKNVFWKNRDGHPELTPEMSRDVLARALYAPNQYANVKPISRPDYRVAIQTGEKTR